MSLVRLTLRFITPSARQSSQNRRNLLGPTALSFIGLNINNNQMRQQQLSEFSSKQTNLIDSETFLLKNENKIKLENGLLNFNEINKTQLRNFSLQQMNYMKNKKPENDTDRLMTHEITKNLTLISAKPRVVSVDRKTMRLTEPNSAPLVLMFAWMLASKKHLLKYAKIYTDFGFDVLTIELNPWQLLWPTKGSQVIAKDVLNFIDNNKEFSLLTIHGFSVGGYLWGEVMALMAHDLQKYQPVLDKFMAQIWDSAADITEIPVGVPKAIFPRNFTLQNALRNYVVYHLKTFHDVATVHYARSSQLFHFSLLKAPALFLVSKTDPIGSESSNMSVKEDLESSGIKTSWKCWDKSPHVLHFHYHTEEYLALVCKHLEENHVFDSIAEKSRAKL